MNILILGNSNSILADGYVYALKKIMQESYSIEINIINLSIGGSPSPALLGQCFLNESRLVEIDLAIVEPTVIDHGEEWQNPKEIAWHASNLLSYLNLKNIKTLLVSLPRNDQAVYSHTKGMISWIDIAKNFSLHYIDAAEVLKSYIEINNCSLKSCWRDNRGHLTKDCHTFLANEIALMINIATVPKSSKINTSNFRVITAEKMYKNSIRTELVYKKNSLMELPLLLLSIGAKIDIDLSSNTQVYGLLINYGSMNGSKSTILNFKSIDKICEVDIKNPFLADNVPNKLLVMYKQLKNQIGITTICLPDCVDNCRLNNEEEHIMLAGILVGDKVDI